MTNNNLLTLIALRTRILDGSTFANISNDERAVLVAELDYDIAQARKAQ